MKRRISAFLCTVILAVSSISFSAYADTYPATYMQTLTSGVRDQKTSNGCWTFTQTELLSISEALKSGDMYNFSEKAILLGTSSNYDAKYGFNRDVNGPGNEYLSLAYISRAGAVMEAEEPFSDTDFTAHEPYTYYGRIIEAPICEYPANTSFTYNAEAINKIKKLIMQYGAVGSSIYYKDEYDNTGRYNYYYNGTALGPNHAVTVVGWDDNYSKDNFKNKPAGNGAFIIRNTWGLYHQNKTSDLVYVSYYDKFITKDFYAVDFSMENELYDTTYQYDYLGWAQNFGYNTTQITHITAATKFTANSSDESVTAVSTYIVAPGMSAKVYINTSCDMTSADNFTLVASRTFTEAGYYVLPITKTALTQKDYIVAIEYYGVNGEHMFALQTNSTYIDNSQTPLGRSYFGSKLTNMKLLENGTSGLGLDQPVICMKAFTMTAKGAHSETNHTFKSYTYNNDATCIKNGTKTATCEFCTAKNTINDPLHPATGVHSFTNYVYNNDATCANDGTKTAKCDNCTAKDTKADASHKATGLHDWSAYSYNNDATCIKNGTKTRTCSKCATSQTIADSDHPATGKHSFGAYKYNKDATTESDGTETATCSVCSGRITRTKEHTQLMKSDAAFVDIKSTSWFKQYTDYVCTVGLMKGTSTTKFEPNANLTRGMFVQILANLEGVDTSNSKVATKFKDVPSGKWYTAAVKWANTNGIVNGTSDTQFSPNGNIQRQQMCVMLVNYAKFKKITFSKKNTKNVFADNSKISAYAVDAVYTCQMAGIVGGKGGNKFDPKGNATRAEVATIMTVFHKEYVD